MALWQQVNALLLEISWDNGIPCSAPSVSIPLPVSLFPFQFPSMSPFHSFPVPVPLCALVPPSPCPCSTFSISLVPCSSMSLFCSLHIPVPPSPCPCSRVPPCPCSRVPPCPIPEQCRCHSSGRAPHPLPLQGPICFSGSLPSSKTPNPWHIPVPGASTEWDKDPSPPAPAVLLGRAGAQHPLPVSRGESPSGHRQWDQGWDSGEGRDP